MICKFKMCWGVLKLIPHKTTHLSSRKFVFKVYFQNMHFRYFLKVHLQDDIQLFKSGGGDIIFK